MTFGTWGQLWTDDNKSGLVIAGLPGRIPDLAEVPLGKDQPIDRTHTQALTVCRFHLVMG